MKTTKTVIVCLSSLVILGVIATPGLFWVLDDMEERVDTPLESAVMAGNVATVRQLVAAGANVRQTSNEDGKTPLHFGDDANLEACRVLIERGADVNASDALGQTPLHLAAYAGSNDYLKLLIHKGARVNVADDQNNTPLHEAVYGDQKQFPLKAKMAAFLLDHGANIDATNQRKETPLFQAASIGNADVFKVLLTRGADTKRRFWEGGTLLHAAATSDKPQFVEILLKRGASINARDSSGMTPLHWAVTWGMDAISDRPRMAKLLIARGADVTLRDISGQTPEDIATQLSRSKTAVVLRQSNR